MSLHALFTFAFIVSATYVIIINCMLTYSFTYLGVCTNVSPMCMYNVHCTVNYNLRSVHNRPHCGRRAADALRPTHRSDLCDHSPNRPHAADVAAYARPTHYAVHSRQQCGRLFLIKTYIKTNFKELDLKFCLLIYLIALEFLKNLFIFRPKEISLRIRSHLFNFLVISFPKFLQLEMFQEIIYFKNHLKKFLR